MWNDQLWSGLCTQDQMDDPEAKKFCDKYLKEELRYHRKQWEYLYVLQQLHVAGLLKSGIKGLGFGVGAERLVPAFAKIGIDLVVTDLSAKDAEGKGWIDTGQHAASLEVFDQYVPDLCTAAQLKKHVKFQEADMNDIPKDLLKEEFDFAWSCCSLEHLGSLKHGMDFIHNTMGCLKPKGLSIHTTEYNLSSETETLAIGPTCIYRSLDILRLKNDVELSGHYLYPISFDPGDKELDQYFDAPPFVGNDEGRHLKLMIGQIKATSVGLVVVKDKLTSTGLLAK